MNEEQKALREAVARAILAADKFLVESGHHHWEYKTKAQRDHYLAAADAAIAVALEQAARVAEAFPVHTHGNLATAPYAAAEQAADEIAAAIRALIFQP